MRYERVTTVNGALLATLVAGPVGELLLALAALFTRSGSWDDLGIMTAGLFFSVPIGMALSILPNLIGAAALGALGRRYDAARHPITWAVVGGAAGVGIGRLLIDNLEPTAMAWFAATGLCCALICRRSARWFD